jgi:hypothetical protein
MRYRRCLARSVAALALLALLAACGGGEVQGQAAAVANNIQEAIKASQPTGNGQQPGAGARPTGTAAAVPATKAPAPAPVTRKIGKTGWYDGFAITVDEITASQGFDDGVDMKVTFSYHNLGTVDATPVEPGIQVAGQVVAGIFDTPGIPGAGTATGTAIFGVQPPADDNTRLSFDDAIDRVTFVYGGAADNHTSIPLAVAAQVDSLEPLDVAPAGQTTQGEIVIEVVGGTLAPSYEPGEKGKSLLNLRVKVSCAAGCSPYGYNTGREEFSVTGPDGKSVTADSRSEYCCDAIYPDVVSDDARNILTFAVPSPGTGAYTLTYDNPSLSSAGSAPATLVVTA